MILSVNNNNKNNPVVIQSNNNHHTEINTNPIRVNSSPPASPTPTQIHQPPALADSTYTTKYIFPLYSFPLTSPTSAQIHQPPALADSSSNDPRWQS